MDGFFSKKETESASRPDGKLRTCISCGRVLKCDNGKMAPVGNFKKGIINILPRPDGREDKSGKPWIGEEAKFIKKAYARLGIDLMDDCLNTYANRCTGEGDANGEEISNCRRNLMKLLKKHKPKLIVTFGTEGIQSVVAHRWKKDFGSVNKWRGWQIPDQDLKAWVCPQIAPETVLSSSRGVEEVIFMEDMKKAVEVLDTPLRTYPEPVIEDITDDLSVLDSIDNCDVVIDFEATGIKPHAEGHRIVCASVAISENKVYVFQIPNSRKKRRPFTEMLKRESVRKIAQNLKYEDIWTFRRLRVSVVNWVYDTMLATHLIDNRPGICSLKFQTYVQFGVVDYDSEINPYLKAKESKNSNAINRIDELMDKPGGVEKLLRYCGFDSIYEFRLFLLFAPTIRGTQGKSHISPINSNFPDANDLMLKGMVAFANAEKQGFRIDVDYCEKQKKLLTRKIERFEAKFKATKLFRQWTHSTKRKINLDSGDQLANLLYNVKKIKPPKYTDSGQGSTDEDALTMIGLEDLDWYIKRSKLVKARDTYLAAFIREQVNGVLHPSYNLHIARTYRSSSSNPNFQNLPKRDKTVMKIVRQAIYPRVGHQLMEMDFSGIEVAIAAAYHKDPTMIKYITDPTSDMHGDTATEIFKIQDWNRKRKDHSYLRSCTKNSFVFPQFYGDYYSNCADNACSNWINLPKTKWKKGMGYRMENGETIGDHLISVGIDSYAKFEKHLKTIEDSFWNDRFPVYTKWKIDHYKDYLKKGYVSMKTGFVCRGIMGKNNAINYPVQGSAFHCLLWTFNELDRELSEGGFMTKLVGQIHDAVVLDTHPDETETVYHLVQEIGTQRIKEAWKWINVPLAIEAELAPVDASWAEVEEWEP